MPRNKRRPNRMMVALQKLVVVVAGVCVTLVAYERVDSGGTAGGVIVLVAVAGSVLLCRWRGKSWRAWVPWAVVAFILPGIALAGAWWPPKENR